MTTFCTAFYESHLSTLAIVTSEKDNFSFHRLMFFSTTAEYPCRELATLIPHPLHHPPPSPQKRQYVIPPPPPIIPSWNSGDDSPPPTPLSIWLKKGVATKLSWLSRREEGWGGHGRHYSVLKKNQLLRKRDTLL
jgi:hypothetical protein